MSVEIAEWNRRNGLGTMITFTVPDGPAVTHTFDRGEYVGEGQPSEWMLSLQPDRKKVGLDSVLPLETHGRVWYVKGSECQGGCGTVIVKFGTRREAYDAPTSGKTIHCPKCDCPRVYDGAMWATTAAYAFGPDGVYLGKMEPPR